MPSNGRKRAIVVISKENRSPNIGELKASKKRDLARQHVALKQHREKQKNITTEAKKSRDKSSAALHTEPLRCLRDPRRVPLQSREPFTTNTHPRPTIHFADSDSSLCSKVSETTRNISGEMKSKSRVVDLEGSKKDGIIPVYAYKNENNLLQISSKPKQPLDVAMGDNGDSVKKGQQTIYYPIALNAGGVGVHTGADFALGDIYAVSHNRHESNCATIKPVLEFPWNRGEGTFSGEKAKLDKAGVLQARIENRPADLETGVIDGTYGTDNSSETVANSAWKIWEKHNNRSIPFNEIADIFRGERNIRQFSTSKKAFSSRKSGVYNTDDFDYALVLAPMQEYADCAEMLDIAAEAGRSIFDRAFDEFTPSKSRRKSSDKSPIKEAARKIRKSIGKYSPFRDKKHSPTTRTPPSRGRRWGNRLMSPPIRSHRKKSPKRSRGGIRSSSVATSRKLETTAENQNNVEQHEKKNANILEIGEIPNPSVPRGLARKQGLEDFIWALEQGFVVRRHRPGYEPCFLKLYTKNQGDTIHYEYIEPEDAIIALKSQIQRYGKNQVRGVGDAKCKDKISKWAPGYRPNDNNDLTSNSQSSLYQEDHPNSLYGNAGRRNSSIGSLIDYATKAATKALTRGHIKAADLIEVQRATHTDPLSIDPDDLEVEPLKGSHTLRQCMEFIKAKFLEEYGKYHGDDEEEEYLATGNKLEREFMENKFERKLMEDKKLERKLTEEKFERKLPTETRTFSLVLNPMIQRFSSTKEANEAWIDGKATYKHFSFLDLETATDGEYWMLFRGFSLLCQDAFIGRFAKDRASGFGSNYRPAKREHQSSNNHVSAIDTLSEVNRKKNSCVGILSKCLEGRLKSGSNISREEKNVLKSKPPPPDFYLGETPGTQIWARLRLAGLEAERIFNLDTKQVMIKIRCPADRLMDVAEVLRLKLKTTDGGFAPFKESLKHTFVQNDVLDRNTHKGSTHEFSSFQSSIRQHIIDYIINSQIRDSGAGLSLRFPLAKKGIKLRSPIHMHARLEALFETWYNFSDDRNWIVVARENGVYVPDRTNGEEGELPPRIQRLYQKVFFLPLDSIEQYYGEKVAFYFAWLQHCSIQLILPSVLGIMVFIFQVTSERREDNWILPLFSVFIMVWSFYVMISWRRRQSDLTHRWGTIKYQEDETPRPQFYGVDDISRRKKFNGKHKMDGVSDKSDHEVKYPAWRRWMKYCLSLPLTIFFTGTAFLGVIMVYTNRDNMLAKYFGDPDQNVGELFDLNWSLSIIGKTDSIVAVDWSAEHLKNPKFLWTIGFFPSMIGLSLPLLNFLLMRLSRVLNDFENHKTESHYRNALIVKVISFRFVAYFAALYYYAFVAAIGAVRRTDDLAVENGFLRIATSLVIYLTIQHWWSLFLQIFIPLVRLRFLKHSRGNKMKSELRELEKMKREYRKNEHLSPEEVKELSAFIENKEILLKQGSSKIWEEMALPDYDPFFDYIQSLVYFAYVVCFGAAFALTPLLVLMNQLINMRLHGYKICRVRRRPLAQKTGGMAVWEHVLHIVTMIGILTNTSLMVLTNSLFNFIRETYPENEGVVLILVIFGWERIMVMIKYLMQVLIPGKSAKLAKKLRDEDRKRNEKLRQEVIDAKKSRRQSSSSSSTIIYPREGSNRSLSPEEMAPKISKKKENRNKKIRKSIKSVSSKDKAEFSALLKQDRNKRKAEGLQQRRRQRKVERDKTPPKTPKRSSSARRPKRMPPNDNSPFNQYICDDVRKNNNSSEDGSPAISEMLSLYSSPSYSDDNDNGYRTPLKPSMQRSRDERRLETEQKAAAKRIQKRLSAPKSEKKKRR